MQENKISEEFGVEVISINGESGSRINPLDVSVSHYEKKVRIAEAHAALKGEYNIVILDPENEYKQFAESLGIEHIHSIEEVKNEESIVIRG